MQIALGLDQTSKVARIEESGTLSWPDQSILLHPSVERFLGDWIMWCETELSNKSAQIYISSYHPCNNWLFWNFEITAAENYKLKTKLYTVEVITSQKKETLKEKKKKKKDKQANDFSACASSADIKPAASLSLPCFIMSQFLVKLQRRSPPVNRWSTGCFIRKYLSASEEETFFSPKYSIQPPVETA